MAELQNKHLLIVGGSSGIGFAIAQRALGIQALVQGLAAEIAPEGRVNAVAPTWTVTPFWREQSREQVDNTRQHFASVIPLGRTAEIDELASAYLFLMKNDFVTGQQLAVDGGIMLG
ncbi:TPA: SDR family oxidoreductase [Raoultella planticola]